MWSERVSDISEYLTNAKCKCVSFDNKFGQLNKQHVSFFIKTFVFILQKVSNIHGGYLILN